MSLFQSNLSTKKKRPWLSMYASFDLSISSKFLVALILLALGCGTLAGNPEEDDDDNPNSLGGEDKGYAAETPEPEIPGSKNAPTITIEHDIEMTPIPGGVESTPGVRFFITDAPVDQAAHVYVTIASLAIHRVKPDTDSSDELPAWVEIPLATSQEFDLLALQNGATLELASTAKIPQGSYDQTRIILASNSPPRIILQDQSEHQLQVPSGAETGIKILKTFDYNPGSSLDFTIDFDLRKSLHKNGAGEYRLQPSLRMIRNIETGSISSEGIQGKSVCVFAEDVAPDAANDCPNAIGSARIEDGEFKIAFLEIGTYRVRTYDDQGQPLADFTNVQVLAGKGAKIQEQSQAEDTINDIDDDDGDDKAGRPDMSRNIQAADKKNEQDTE